MLNQNFRSLIVFLISFISFADALPQADDADFHRMDKIRIREALNIFEGIKDSLWKGWEKAPFALLLVTDENEYLINHPKPTDDFTLLYNDTILGSDVYKRKRKYSSTFLATFPAVGGVSTIVVGTSENTGRPSMDWIITILHEHFHQLQYTSPDMLADVDKLQLAGDDKTGMWMINYNFPYEDKEVAAQYKRLIRAAKKAYLTTDVLEFMKNVRAYRNERKKFKELLDEDDYKYFSFQIWQEGYARYTELKISEWMVENYKPAMEFTWFEDYETADVFHRSSLKLLLDKVETQNLSEDKRNCFYTLGGIEGLLLDRANPGWRDQYFKKKFFTEKYFQNKQATN